MKESLQEGRAEVLSWDRKVGWGGGDLLELRCFHGTGKWGGEGEICCCVKESLQEGRAEVLSWDRKVGWGGGDLLLCERKPTRG